MISLFYKRSREVPCISLLVAAGFVLNAIFPLEYFSNMAVMDEIAGVPNETAPQKSRSAGCFRAGWLKKNFKSELAGL